MKGARSVMRRSGSHLTPRDHPNVSTCRSEISLLAMDIVCLVKKRAAQMHSFKPYVYIGQSLSRVLVVLV
jgi:hypothetical protein